MKCNVKAFRVLLVCFLVLAFHPSVSAFMQEPGGEPPAAPALGSDAKPIPTAGGMPGWPVPDKPIPHHEPGHLSRADSYRTEVQRPNELGMLEMVEISGADAMAADGVDPLAGNYTLVGLDKILMSTYDGGSFTLRTFSAGPSELTQIQGSQRPIGDFRSNDIAAADVNGDGWAEQIAAWVDPADNHVHLSIGEMPGSLGRTTSAPAAVAHTDGTIDLLVRGYDDALWHRRYNDSSWGEWNNDAGGFLLSAPAIASQGDGQFDVFVIQTDNQVYRRHWEGGWSGGWQQYGQWSPISAWTGATPELPAPAAVARGGQVDVFRLGPDNTLRWHNGTGWESLGGMLASGPVAISSNEDHVQVFARGVDEALWHRTYNGAWGPWQRLELEGMDEGVTIASAPTAVALGSGQIDVYVRGSDSQLWKIAFDGSGWGSWRSLGGQLASGVAVAAGDWRFIAQVDDGTLQHSGNGTDWTAWDGLLPCCAAYDTSLLCEIRDVNPYEDYSLDVETGYFLGDGRSQIALAYLSSSNTVTIALYEMAGGFMPQLVGQVEAPHDIDWFSITAGDYLDRDGIDEVALAYAHGSSYGLDIIRVADRALEVAKEGEAVPGNSFAGTLDAASGDFDYDGQDEIAVISVGYYVDWEQFTSCDTWHYVARLRIFDILKDLHTDEYRINTYWVEAHDDREADNVKDLWSVGLAIASGDVDGDGKDEIIRTWPTEFGVSWAGCMAKSFFDNGRLYRQVQVLTLPTNESEYSNAWKTEGDGQIDSKVVMQGLGAEGPSWNSYMDRLAVGDLDRDLRDEIVWYFASNSGSRLHTYDYNEGQFDSLDPSLPLASYPNLVTGDFTGEGIRVGRPTYRVQNRVDTLLAVINMPPQHRDLIQDAEGNVQLIESPAGDCQPSPDSPGCTHAKYAKRDFQSSEQTIQTVHAYEISAGVESEACAGVGVEGIGEVKACARNSINLTHGGNFENSTTELHSVAVRRKVIAANDDKVVYFGTPFGVWEYPVLSGASGEMGDDVFITVAFPLVSTTQYPDTAGGYYAGTCDETWFYAGHQPNNVWSYDPIGDINFADYSDKYEPVYDAIEGDWAEGEIAYKDLASAFEGMTFKHSITARHEEEVTAEAKLGLVDVSGSFKAHLQGDYKNTYMKTDKLTDIQDTAFSYFFAPQPDDAKFTTRVLFYRGKDDSQIMNYQTEPGRSASWQLYDKPDPAFVLPWYGFPDPDDPQVPPCGEDQKLFSPDVFVDPPLAGVGEMVTVTARVRNFSNVQTENVLVRFYLGQPATGGSVIGEGTIPVLSRQAGPRTVSIAWEAAGLGQQRIFAVIDPDDRVPEMHDGGDLIDNNVAYGLFRLSSAAYADMGWAEVKPYDVISYTLAEPANVVSLHVPRASLSAVTRFELAEAVAAATAEALVGHTAFEVQAFQGSKFTLWDEPIEDFDLKPDAEDPPAIITVAYTDASVAGLEEANLTLYRFEGDSWQPATCPGYRTVRFPDDNLLAVPVCQTGVFALGTGEPQPLPGYLKYLPSICCDRCGWLSSSESQSLTTP